MPPKGKKNKGRTKHAAPKFIQNADELANRDEEMAAQKAQRKARRKEAGCSDSEEDEDGVDDDAGGFLGAAADMARLKMAEEDAAQGGAAEDRARGKPRVQLMETANPNAKKPASAPISTKKLANGEFEKKKLTRREREEFEKQAAERRYWSKIEDGTHAQAKKDLARLAEIKKRREEAEAKKKADAEKAKQEEVEAKAKAKALNAAQPKEEESEKDKILKFTKIEIKKMKPAVLKEHLKELGLPIQGNAKKLTAALLQACGHAWGSRCHENGSSLLDQSPRCKLLQ